MLIRCEINLFNIDYHSSSCSELLAINKQESPYHGLFIYNYRTDGQLFKNNDLYIHLYYTKY